ncbi:hypothetical protein PUN28_009151 [Cardiocondyla obscurior]|uniref:Evolutionarily conserved signaling intermediate in Toll pathway, mitochondrial n=1 Tax=Cardiocondyla obscurior TaxID=286306 RepID=A0AAW2FWH8_9HYME
MLSRIIRSILASNVTALLRQPVYELKGRSFSRAIHTSRERNEKNDKKDEKSDIILHAFANVEEKKKESYLEVLRQYKSKNEMRHGHVEFIRIALRYIDEFGANRDLAVYKELLDVLPKGKFVPRNYYQTIFLHYPLQQNVAVDVLSKMEDNCVMPDKEMQDQLLNIFGKHGLPLKKFWRMMYWMPKFAHLNPWPCSRPAPKDPQVLARMAMSKMSSVDVQSEVTDFDTKDVEEAIEDTWIVSAMSRLQEELLQRQPVDTPIYVEGPYTVWVADQCIDYFILKGTAREIKKVEINIDDVSNIKIPFWESREITFPLTVHEQSDGIYFAMCATGTSSKDSLLSWIRCLQKKNPILTVIPVVFKLMSSTREQLFIASGESEKQIVQ